MSKLMQAVDQSKTVMTENGMPALATTKSYVLDLFGKAGSARNADLSSLFLKALGENDELTARVLLWTRDVRGGAGERNTFRNLLQVLISNDIELASKVLAKTPEVGRWDDVLVALDTRLEDQAVSMIRAALESGDGLCAKWMPRKGEVASKLRQRLGYSPKFYRKRLVELTTVVETQMCAKDWNNIKFDHVPSVAMTRYTKAFARNTTGFANYMAAVDKGEAKINMGVAFPHDVIRTLRAGEGKNADIMWNNLPDLLADTTERFIPVIDVSGSMDVSISGSVRAIDVAIGLGIYCAQRNRSAFAGETITFSARPEYIKVGKSLKDAYNQVMRGHWGMNTNLEAVFTMILSSAVKGRVSPEDMPTKILIMSDMQFDRCIHKPESRAFTMIRDKYEAAGYKMPNVVFWNLCGRETTVPISIDDDGTALVSGFSPMILKSLMNGDLNPMGVMLKTIMVPRYNLD